MRQGGEGYVSQRVLDREIITQKRRKSREERAVNPPTPSLAKLNLGRQLLAALKGFNVTSTGTRKTKSGYYQPGPRAIERIEPSDRGITPSTLSGNGSSRDVGFIKDSAHAGCGRLWVCALVYTDGLPNPRGSPKPRQGSSLGCSGMTAAPSACPALPCLLCLSSTRGPGSDQKGDPCEQVL